jgi:uncharacterized protein
MSPTYRRILKLARYVHVYLTLSGLALILLFAVTGFMLNHDGWFGLDQPVVTTAKGTMRTEIVAGPDKLAVVESLRAEYGASGALTQFEIEDDRLQVMFTGPGKRFEATIDRKTGEVEFTAYRSGVSGVLADLHKGKQTGRAWGLVIDAVCVLLVVVALTGLVLWSALKNRGKYGLVAMLLGAAIALTVYWLGVP